MISIVYLVLMLQRANKFKFLEKFMDYLENLLYIIEKFLFKE